MREANNLEINVDKIMDSIRDEVANHQGYPLRESTYEITSLSNKTIDFNYIEALLNNAESRAYVRTKWPDKYNRFPFNISNKIPKLVLKIFAIIFRDQQEVNFNLLQALKKFLLLNRQLIEQIATNQAQVSALDKRLQSSKDLVTAMDKRLQVSNERVSALHNYLQALNERVAAIDNHLQASDERVAAIDNHIQASDERVAAIDNHIQASDERVAAIDNHIQASDERVAAIDNHLQASDERVAAIDNHLQASDERVAALYNHIQASDERVAALYNHIQASDERVAAIDNHLQGNDKRISAIDESHLKNDSYIKNDLSQQKRLIALFLEEARQRLSEPFNQEQLQSFANEKQHSLDAFYAAFEDQFRGSREEIINRLKVYLPLIQEIKTGTPELHIVDVGCGRGEWLEILREFGYIARGIDTNRVMIDQCKTRGLEVIEEDGISYLQSLPDAELDVVSGFHIIEHLPFEVLIKLFDETIRVLKPGGIAIFETPNSQNLLVSSNSFYLDPTHLHLLPSPLIKFVAESRGLCQVKLMPLHPYPENFKFSGSDIAERFNDYFYGPQDYAVIGYKL